MKYTDIDGWFSWESVCDEFVEKGNDDSTIVEHQITKDGILYFSWHSESSYGGGGETNVDIEKNT